MDIEFRQQGTCLVARVKAESIDYTVCDTFKQTILGEVEKCNCDCMLLNLTDVSFVDSMTIGALVTLKKAIAKRGGTLGMCNLHPYVTKIIRVVTLNTIFNIYDTEKQALADM